jgi:hypothetical protein
MQVPQPKRDGGSVGTGERAVDAGTGEQQLPGTHLEFELIDSVYIDLSVPAVVRPSSSDTFTWDLLFDGLTLYTNSGAVGPGFGASFGPSSELDLLFDSAPAVPLRADVSSNALFDWYWFGPNGVTSRFHTYGVRDEEGRVFKLQVLSYYDNSGGEPRSAVYTLRFAQATPNGMSDTIELAGIDASAGGVTLPPTSPAGCVDLATGTQLQLSEKQWLASTEWDVCFQRTEVFVNGGLSGNGAVQAIDLDALADTDAVVTPEEQQQTAESARLRFAEIDYTWLTRPGQPWERQYEVRPRIGTRWLDGEHANQSPTTGSWIVRGADGEQHYALYFTNIANTSATTRAVGVQVKALAPPSIVP